MRTFVVPFSFCNLGSIKRMLSSIKVDYLELTSESCPEPSDIIILPGVGTFEQGMTFLENQKLTKILANHFDSDGYIIGICLGMQLLLESSEESPGVSGLGIIPGLVSRLHPSQFGSVPHIGWNELTLPLDYIDPGDFLLDKQVLLDHDFYFVHSFCCLPVSSDAVCAQVLSSNTPINVIIRSRNTLGLQFHPEKSGVAGELLIKHIFNCISHQIGS